MKAAFILYDRMTTLDFVGVYDVLTRLKSMGFLPEFQWDLCGLTRTITDDRGLTMCVGRVHEPLDGYDLVIVPGGYGSRELIEDQIFLGWLSTASETPLTASVCSGSLLLGAVGLLKGRRATSHPSVIDQLSMFKAVPVKERIVDDGQIVTSGGVTASIDLGLYLVTRLVNQETAQAIATQMDYPYLQN